MSLSLGQIAAQDRSITPTPLGTYVSAANGDEDLTRTLYLWNRDLVVAFLGDLAILEVAPRNAMSAQLEARWGADWYSNPEMSLDERSSNEYSLEKDQRAENGWQADRLIGLRFLARAPGQARTQRKTPRQVRCDHEVLWRGVLDKAFPGGRLQAQEDNARWNRGYALGTVSRVDALRNRVAHHEPLINGLPLPGQNARLSAREAHEDTMRLATMVDRDLHGITALESLA